MANPDFLAALVGIIVFAAIMGGAALFRSYRDAAHRLERDRLANLTRRASDGGRYIGGCNRPGEN